MKKYMVVFLLLLSSQVFAICEKEKEDYLFWSFKMKQVVLTVNSSDVILSYAQVLSRSEELLKNCFNGLFKDRPDLASWYSQEWFDSVKESYLYVGQNFSFVEREEKEDK
jgi:hypothetical protein